MYVTDAAFIQSSDKKKNEPTHEKRVLITWQTAKAQASLRIRAVSQEPSLFAHTLKGVRDDHITDLFE